MSDHFVKYINIERYKCFDDFSAEGFRRVNLISGRNNVGKTALLEALFINVYAENVQAMVHGLIFLDLLRNKVDGGYELAHAANKMRDIAESFHLATNVSTVSARLDNSSIPGGYEITVSSHEAEISNRDMMEILSTPIDSESAGKACYIGSFGDSQKSIISSFTAIQKKDRESDVYKILQQFDSSIENVKVIGGDSIQCKVIGSDGDFSYRNLSEFGEGLRHYLSVIADLFKAEDRYLFIDELDNGIHYTALDQLWELILNLSKELNVQIFATTHSRECIESYCRVAEKLKEEDISFITLVRNKEKAVKAIVRDYEVFTDSIHDDREVRGW